jgi:glycosyltransferase involved in cell wall biosynthesis
MLNNAIAREIQVSIQYMWQHVQWQGVKGYATKDAFEDIAKQEMKHAEMIAERLWYLSDGKVAPTTKPDPINVGKVLKEMASQYPHIRILGFKKNCGETAAGAAGLKEAKGEVVITIDADLQNDPKDIPTLLAYLKDYDMVTGWRQKRDDSWVKRVTSKIANKIRNWLSGETIRDSGCTFRAYKRECLQNLKLYKGMHRFMPTLVRMEGFRVIEIPISHRPRKFGVSKYNTWNRMWRAFVDLLAVKWMKSRHIYYEIEERI